MRHNGPTEIVLYITICILRTQETGNITQRYSLVSMHIPTSHTHTNNVSTMCMACPHNQPSLILHYISYNTHYLSQMDLTLAHFASFSPTVSLSHIPCALTEKLAIVLFAWTWLCALSAFPALVGESACRPAEYAHPDCQVRESWGFGKRFCRSC